jgi:hypothetical protein
MGVISPEVIVGWFVSVGKKALKISILTQRRVKKIYEEARG